MWSFAGYPGAGWEIKVDVHLGDSVTCPDETNRAFQRVPWHRLYGAELAVYLWNNGTLVVIPAASAG